VTATTGTAGTAGTAEGGRRGRGSIVFWLVVLGAIVALAIIGGAPSPSIPLSPRSTTPEGTRGLVLFLEELGATVDIGRDAPDDEVDVALVLADGLGAGRRAEVRSWVEEGGTLVVADPGSPLAATVSGDDDGDGQPDDAGGFDGIDFELSDRGSCDVDVLDGADRISIGGTDLFATPSVAFEVGDEMPSCFGDFRRALIVSEQVGRGTIVSIGDPDLFINQNLDADDNAVVASALLAPTQGTAVRFLEAPFQVRERTLTDLVPDNIIRAFIQVLIAFVVYALWRGRRLGRPVAEVQPVEVAGSELVAAVGGLLEVTGAPDRAAELLRADLRRDLGVRFGIAPDTPTDVVAEIVAERSGADPRRLAAALTYRPPQTDADLVELARLIDSVRQEVFRGQRA
jgi:Domain of unknown function (DUF4350)